MALSGTTRLLILNQKFWPKILYALNGVEFLQAYIKMIKLISSNFSSSKKVLIESYFKRDYFVWIGTIWIYYLFSITSKY